MLPLQNLDFLKSETYPLFQCQDTLSSSGAKNLKIRLETDLNWYYFNFMNIVKFFMLLNTLILNDRGGLFQKCILSSLEHLPHQSCFQLALTV